MVTQTAARATAPAKSARRDRASGIRPAGHALGVPARLCTALWRGAAATALVAVLAALVSLAAEIETSPARAAELPRFVSLKSDLANLRVGPGRRYPIDWVYKRRGLPLLVLQHFDQWRWVRDHEGTKGWMHRALLSTHRTAVIVDGVQTMRESPSSSAPAILRAEAGVIADFLDCEGRWCRITLAGEEGWVPESALWGAVVPPP